MIVSKLDMCIATNSSMIELTRSGSIADNPTCEGCSPGSPDCTALHVPFIYASHVPLTYVQDQFDFFAKAVPYLQAATDAECSIHMKSIHLVPHLNLVTRPL